MAAYAELLTINNTHDALKQKVLVACIVACIVARDAIRVESGATPNRAARPSWARNTLQDPSR